MSFAKPVLKREGKFFKPSAFLHKNIVTSSTCHLYQQRFLLLVYSLLTMQVFSQPVLVITNGQVVTLPARTHLFSRIDIQAGGTLLIEEHSTQWCILYCSGNVTINGTIVFEKFLAEAGPYVASAPDGISLSHTFRMSSHGGRGGDGGPSTINRQFANGGDGADGGTEYGGGGGSGGGWQQRPPAVFRGNNGNADRGGNSVSLQDGAGGNGARRGRWSNGGLLYIYCGGDFNGAGGRINLKGSDGAQAANGEQCHFTPVTGSITYYAGCGGGGGGAPGGDGGICQIRVRGNIITYPTVNITGGLGGEGGNGGVHNGRKGERGQTGLAGLVDYHN
jgi:hypothetical protein